MKNLIMRDSRVALLGIGAIMLASGTFAVATGDAFANPGSLIAQAISAISGRPVVLISRDANSPSGAVMTQGLRPLAIFSMRTNNVSRATTIKSLSVEIKTSGKAADSLVLSQPALTYRFCIEKGVSYGYGYKGTGGCGTRQIPLTKSDKPNTYVISAPFIVYPQQSGTLTVSAHPKYQKAGTGVASVRATVTGSGAVGDQCKSISYSKGGAKYGYQGKCVFLPVPLNTAHGLTLKVNRSYGY